MAHLTRDTIKTLSTLCRIECSEEEQDALLVDLEKILDYVDQLNEIDTDGVTPCNCVLEEAVNVMREDRVGETLSRDRFLGNAPAHVGGMVKVPPVLANKSS